ncbi:MAG: Xaa-Pro peptidase family protein [bacterium]|nr:Xaa-Pro peptidase family protein [bacterium]
MNYAERRANVVRQMRAQKVHALLVSNPTNVYYLTGFKSSNASLVMTGSDAALLTDFRYEAMLRAHVATQRLTPIIMEDGLAKALGAYCQQHRIRTLAYEADYLTVSLLQTLQRKAGRLAWTPAKNWIGPVRDCKEPAELAEMRRAITIAQQAFLAIKPGQWIGLTELAAAELLEGKMREIGRASGLHAERSFDSIVACGAHAAEPHHHCDETVIPRATMLKIDWGVRVNDYCSDLTRTLFLGTPTQEFRDIYAIVLRAQRAAIAAVRPGVPLCEVDAAARAVITKAGFGDKFGHNTGHGIGLQVHEGSGPQKRSTAMAKPGMVITIEPGIYLPEWGGVRIEDMVLVTDTGRRVLTSVPK